MSFLPDQAVVLIAEDLENDTTFLRRAFQVADVKNPLFVVRDGEQCLAYLNGIGKFANRDEYPLPDLLLLDIKMPKVDGFEVLREIRKNKSFAALRIIMLTASEEATDVNEAYELGANSFLVKPCAFEEYPKLVRTLSKFWLRSSVAPKIERPPKNKPGKDNGPQSVA